MTALPLAGRLAVVTGGSRGIGLATAVALAAAGAAVVRLARSLTPGADARFHDLPCDLSRADAVEQAADRILTEWGTPAVVVQNAGTFLLQSLEQTGAAELDHQLALNLRAPFLLARRLLPAMRGAGGGSHVLIGSTADHLGFPENSAYSAGKFGARGLHEVLTAEYAGSGIRFTLISPGATDTAIWDPYDPDSRPGFPPRRTMLRAEDVAGAVLFAVSLPAHATVEWLRLRPTPPALGSR